MNFITKSTRTKTIVASVLTGIALITLIMLSSLLNIESTTKTIMCFLYTVGLMLVLLFWQGLIQINVFNDYKCQKKMLCADGILNLCFAALITISGILFASLQVNAVIKGIELATTDIRVFIVAFLLALTFWKIATFILSIKEKRYNWWLEMVFAILWLAISIVTFISILSTSLIGIAWTFVAMGWALIVTTIFYSLYSYVIREPEYLETEKAIAILKKEEERREFRQAKLDGRIETKKTTLTSDLVKEKLKRLKELKDANLISQEDYDEKKAEIIDSII
jgi:hypothetical protein